MIQPVVIQIDENTTVPLLGMYRLKAYVYQDYPLVVKSIHELICENLDDKW